MRALAFALLVIFGLAQAAWAQSGQIAVLYERRLFTASAFGESVRQRTQAAIDTLVAENKLIEADLEREERELAQKRTEMDPAAFRELANAFDARVTSQRQERAEREQALTAQVQEAERAFQDVANQVLAEFARERGFTMIFPGQGMIYVDPALDITDQLIDRINQRFPAP